MHPHNIVYRDLWYCFIRIISAIFNSSIPFNGFFIQAKMKNENPYAYILTLLSSSERRTNVHDNIIPYLEQGRFEIYPAIDARTNELEFFREKHPEVNRISLTDPEDGDLRTRMALIYGFSRILEDVRSKNRNNFIFFEDDAVLLPMFYDNLQKALEQTPQGWDVLKLHCCRQPLNTGAVMEVAEYPDSFGGSFYGTDAIIFSDSGITKIIKLLYSSQLRGIDSLVHDVGIRAGALKGYYVNNTICAHQHGFLKTTGIGKRYGY